MLVFYRYPYGSTNVDGVQVYGYLEKFPPARVSWNSFKNNQGSLIQASYTKDRLELLFPGSQFPNISFMYSDLRYLSWEQMCALCKGFGLITSRKNNDRRKALREFLKEKV